MIRNLPALRRTALGCDAGTPRDQGFTLAAAIAILLVGSVILAGLLDYTYATLHSTASYQVRSNESQNAADSVTYAIQLVRTDPTVGPIGSARTYHYKTPAAATVDVVCVGKGVGNSVVGFSQDRTVDCNGSQGGVRVQARVRFYDQVANPGAAVEVVSWNPIV